MRTRVLPLLLLLAGPAAADSTEDADLAFLKDMAETRRFNLGEPAKVRLTPDGATVLFLRSPPRLPEASLFAMDVASGAVREVLTPEQLLKGAAETLSPEERALRERKRVGTRGFTGYDLSQDGKLLLLQLSGRAYVVPVAGGQAREVAGPDAKGNPIFAPDLAPDGKSVAFVRGDELWVAPVAGGPARQLSHGAGADIVHGQADFVASEELDRFEGHWWSPDSKSLLYQESDSTGVERFRGGDAARPFDGAEPQPYPRPGQKNIKVSLGIVAAGGGPNTKTTWIDWDRKAYEYVEDVSWQPGAPPAIVLRSRDQRDVSLVAADPKTGRTRELVHEHDEVWVELGMTPHWLRDGSGFLWPTDRRGAWQLELRDPGGGLRRELAPASWGDVAMVHLDEVGHTVVVARRPEPVESQLWRLPLAGGEPVALTQGPDQHSAIFARDSEAHILSTFGREDMRRTVIRADGSAAGDLPSVAEKRPFKVNLEVVKLAGFWTAIIRPRAFDPKRKYPVVVDVYGGPAVRTVYPLAGEYIAEQWFADHGFIVFLADNRGTPGRGHDWERAMKDAFATVPLEDQVKALQAAAAHEPAMDLARVGIKGGSFGGYMAALAVMRRPDVYKAAVADAPVVDWMEYDTAYCERYLGVPPPAGDSKAYEANGLLPYVKDLSRPLLVLHGTADDNVHFVNSLILADAAFRAGVSQHLELLPMPGLTHMFNDPKFEIREWQRVFGFFARNLR